VRRHQRRFDAGGLQALGRPSGFPRGRARLPAARTDLVNLWKEQGSSNRETARRLGVTEKAVRKLLRRLGWRPELPEQLTLDLDGADVNPALCDPALLAEVALLDDEKALPSGTPVADSNLSAPDRDGAEPPTLQPTGEAVQEEVALGQGFAPDADPNLSAPASERWLPRTFDTDPTDRRVDRLLACLNLDLLREKDQGYVVGLNRRRNAKICEYIEQATGEWAECPVGITAAEKATPPRTRVQEVATRQQGVRVFVVESEERLAYERAERLKAMARVREELDKLQRRVENGRLKVPEKIGAAAARILARNHGQRYYAWEYEDGTFRYFEHPVNLEREKTYEGKYVIQTEEPHLRPVEAVQIYKSLSEVEMAFRNLKDVIEMRPIYHQTGARVEAHIFVAALAFLLQRALDRKLKAAGSDLSPTQALQALQTIRVVDLDLGNGQTKRTVTRGSARCLPILRALGITDLEPTTPPVGDPDLM
jgi:hypothetical protein